MFYGLVAFATLQKQGKASFEAADKNIESGKASFGAASVPDSSVLVQEEHQTTSNQPFQTKLIQNVQTISN